eukprot:scpid33758/ scgid26387/ Glutamine-rich protein 2
MAVALDALVDLAVGTNPQSQINVHNLNDLLHSMVRWLAASGQGGSSEAAAKLPPLLDSSGAIHGQSSSGTASAVGGSGTSDGATGEAGISVGGGSGGGSDGAGAGPPSSSAGGGAVGREGTPGGAIDSGVNSPWLYALSEGEVRSMENKLNTLESRLDTLNSLDELQRRAADGATPLADMWNFSTITRRLEAAEAGVAKVCAMMDELAKELSSMRQRNTESDKRSEEMSKRLSDMSDELTLLQGSDRADSGARNKLQDIADELNALKTDVNENFAKCEDLEDLVTWQALEDCLKARIPDPSTEKPALQPTTRQERVKSAKKASPSHEAMEALQQVGALTGKHDSLVGNVTDLENALAGKLTAEDIANLAPKEHIELVAELQARVLALEDQKGEFSALKELVDQIKQTTDEASALDSEKLANILNSHSANEQLIKDMASQMGILRDQLSVLEKTVDALQNAALQQTGPPPTIDPELIEGFRSQVTGMKDEQQLLHDALKELLRDVTENKQHVQQLYQGVESLEGMKADKEYVTLEVEEKADRQSLDDKASRAWVDNHIHQLTAEILEAKDKVSGQDEKLQGALDRLTNDVDGKLDRLELEPLKAYLESKIPKGAPAVAGDGGKGEEGDWDAAGMRRALLKFHCISCDRPVLMKADGPVNPLPVAGSMRPQKVALRPANIQELEAMREQQRRFVSGLHSYPASSFLPSLRSCGGGHTLTHPTRRARLIPPITNVIGQDGLPPPQAPRAANESDVVGQNGQVYRGRMVPNSSYLPQLYQPPNGAKGGARRFSKSAKSARISPGKDDQRPISSMDVTAHSMNAP